MWTYFCDAIVHYFLNFGLIHDFKKRSGGFELQNTYNKRIIYWNEPICEPGAFEQAKTFLGGDSTNVHIKFEDDVFNNRTPVIITSNNYVFPRNDATFNFRIFYSLWRECPPLSNYTKKLYPLALANITISPESRVFNSFTYSESNSTVNVSMIGEYSSVLKYFTKLNFTERYNQLKRLSTIWMNLRIK